MVVLDLVTLNNRIGAILIGSWVNVMLFTLESTQIYRYFTHYSSDRLAFKVTVIVLFLFDIACTVSTCATYYLYAVLHWGDNEYLNHQTITIPVYLATTGATALIVQTFLLNRYWHLTRIKTIYYIVLAMIVVAFLGAMCSCILMIIFTSYADRNKNVYGANFWLVSSAVTDIFLAVALFNRLVSANVQSDSSKRLVGQLCALAAKTGSLTAFYALVTLVSYLVKPESNICIGFGASLGRVYSITLLYNLNIRQKLQPQTLVCDLESIIISGATEQISFADRSLVIPPYVEAGRSLFATRNVD